jgi:hypothetical protein
MLMVGSPGIGTISSLVTFDDETLKVFLIAVQYLIASIWHPFAAVLVSAWFSWALHPANDNVIDSESMATARILTFMPYCSVISRRALPAGETTQRKFNLYSSLRRGSSVETHSELVLATSSWHKFARERSETQSYCAWVKASFFNAVKADSQLSAES